MRNFFRLFIPLCALVSCKPRVETITINVTPLPASSIYDADAVFHYLEKHADSNKELANYYFNKGIQNQVANIPEAIHFIKRSLTLSPESERYLKLGSLLYADKDYEEMNDLYRVLVSKLPSNSNTSSQDKYLFGKPGTDIVENFVVSNILAYNNVWSNKAEEIALTDSLKISMNDIKKMVLSDGRIKLDKPTAENKNILWQILTNDEKAAYFNTEPTPEYMVNSMEDTSSVFEIDRNRVAEFWYQYSYRGSNRYEMEDRLDNLQSKFNIKLVLEFNKNEPDFHLHSMFQENFEKSFKITDSVKAVVYAIDTSAADCPKEMRNIYHRLVTYRDFKHIIATKILAVQAGEQLSTVKFNHDKFTITYFKRYWEKPFKSDDFDNHLSKIEQTEERNFEINHDGTIKENLHE